MTENTPPQQELQDTPRKCITLKRILLSIILCLLAIGAYVAFDAYRFMTTPASEAGKEIIISIPQGATFDRVAWELKKQGAITDVPKFRLLARYEKLIGAVKAGDFLVNTGWTPSQVLWQITSGQAILHRLVLREGLTWWETAKALEDQGFAKYEDVKRLIHDPEFLAAHHIPFSNAEGFLFPETYLVKKPEQLNAEQAKVIVGMLIDTFWQKTKPVWQQLPPNEQGKELFAKAQSEAAKTSSVYNATTNNATQPTPLAEPPLQDSSLALEEVPIPLGPEYIEPEALHRLLILASLVEKETSVPAERPRVAGVYANRLEHGWLLQCDPTIIYGIGEAFSGSIRRSQLDDAGNIYNTYQHAGLPPGPIASVGLASVQAAFTPEKHDYFYFVATGVDKGHTFSKTLSEHNKAVEVYRRNIRNRSSQ